MQLMNVRNINCYELKIFVSYYYLLFYDNICDKIWAYIKKPDTNTGRRFYQPLLHFFFFCKLSNYYKKINPTGVIKSAASFRVPDYNDYITP